jgi:hypothetical protein
MDSVERCVLWTHAHVGKEVFKGHPPVANRYSPASVLAEVRVSGVQAPLLHTFPCVVCRRACEFVSPLGAPARPAVAAQEMISPDGFFCPTLTPALPVIFQGVDRPRFVRKPNNSPAAKYTTSKVFHRSPSSSRVSQKMLGRAVTETAFSGATLAEPSILAHVSQGVPSRG